MSIYRKRFLSNERGQTLLLGAAIILFLLPIIPVLAPQNPLAEAEASFNAAPTQTVELTQTPMVGNNAFIANGTHYLRLPGTIIMETLPVTVTAYSSSVWETDDTPFITASGTTVRDGIVASNLLPFGTKIRIPEVFGNKIFVVEDRMSQRAGYAKIDVWFPSHALAEDFGAKYTYIETVKY